MFKIKQRRDCYFDEFILFYFFSCSQKIYKKRSQEDTTNERYVVGYEQTFLSNASLVLYLVVRKWG